MFNNFEKSITFVANIIAIITFGLSIFNWLGFGFIAETSIPTARAAKCILCIYCFLASYGQAKALDEHAKKYDNSVLLWLFLSFSYVFGFLFLLEKAKAVLNLTENTEVGPISLAWTANILIMLAIFFFRRMYPKGGVVAYFKNFFGGIKALYFFLCHMLGLGALFMVLH